MMNADDSTSECIPYFLGFGPKSTSELIKVTERGKVAVWNTLCRLYRAGKVWRTKELPRERCRNVKGRGGVSYNMRSYYVYAFHGRETFFRV
ncbi:MAG: hypothetical protein ACFE68_05130 [Candidatus Hodarchaeota archaeon]